MMKRILLVAVAVIVGAPLLVTAWFYIGGIETGDTSLRDDADLLWTAPDVADEDNAFIAIMAATNLINCTTLGTNSWDKVDMSFVSGYANINTNRDSTARRIRADPGAGEKADRILADNEAFYSAFAKGLERNEFRNADPIIKELGYPFPSVLLYMRMAQFWRLKIRREAERGEWEKAANSLEVLRRFGRFVSDGKANRFPEFSIGIMMMENVLNEMVGLVVMGGYGEDSLLRFAAIAKEDEAAFSSNCTHVVRGEYTHIVAELPKKRAADLLRTLDCDSSFRRICPVLEHWPFYRDFALGERWTRRRLADVAHSFLRGEIDYAVYERFYPGNPFVRNWAGRERVYGFALCCGNLLGGSWGNRRKLRLHARAQLVIAAARWRLAHDGEMPPSLDALVPQYLPAVPADPWSKDGKPLNYDAATGVVWSVGESGDFDYSKLPVEKSRRLRGKIGKYVDRFAFRLDGKPLELLDNAR